MTSVLAKGIGRFKRGTIGGEVLDDRSFLVRIAIKPRLDLSAIKAADIGNCD
jgi:hypothetical protein